MLNSPGCYYKPWFGSGVNQAKHFKAIINRTFFN